MKKLSVVFVCMVFWVGLLGVCLKSVSAEVWGTAQVVAQGDIKRVYATYSDSDTIQIQTGYGECNGNYFEVTSAINHDMTSIIFM